jgi:uncharacterized protein (DUF58 family)
VARRWVGVTRERRDVVRSLRDHRPGDDRRAIHWRSSARRGALVVKEFERTAPNQSLVVLDLASPAGQDPEQAEATVEAAVTLAASLLAGLARGGERFALGIAAAEGERLLRLGAGEPGLARGLKALALVEPALGPALGGLARRAAFLLAESRVLLVTTRAASLGGRAYASIVGRAQVFDVSSPADAEACYADRQAQAAPPPGRPESV